MSEHICVNPEDCCRALSRAWKALGITEYNGKSIEENIVSLLAQVREAEALKAWQPIVTAPKDGHQIIVTGWHGTGAAYWAEAVTYSEDSPRCDEPASWRWCGDKWRSGRLTTEPTHWQPLPPPPAREGSEE